MTPVESGHGHEWRVDVETPEQGWVLIPEADTDQERERWVQERLTRVRAAGTEQWPTSFDEYLTTVFRDAFAHVRPEDALVFQVWPSAQPISVYVHVAFGLVDPDDVAFEPGSGILYEGAPGQGVHLPLVEATAGGDYYGSRYVFAGHGRALVVDVEPTTLDELVALTPALHSMLQRVTVTLPDGTPFRAETPALLGAGEGWALEDA
ncbi:hypothetical protein JCM13591A_04200 [Microbacterium xylanilyticum]